ncbi:hypothetical protein UFOVP1138_39 [uncultured Caudovirales phage]|uniref:Uncharacterized protein n=1 Tax=uncultured Caudovirales phage TaxID=2100421 RepID=A0A6J5QUK2_9CAUD|nr:hypothetical protein UFOVP975_82 [uncultured Caudovirales phage]CAB4186247.1 hypothetical protein UFOVP1138_39 [uncultured Caudovirales phage]CAB4204416.1 hypothetical protein UFOVP1394_36 [uncultured Caudovirales phage]
MKEKGKKKEEVTEPSENIAVEATPLNALQSTNDDEPIAEYTPEPEIKELSLGLEDRSKLNDNDKHDTLVRLLLVLPKQYVEAEEQLKRNIWNIGRFEPTNAQIQAAREAIANDPKRNPR